jgi:hypothetical protein
MTIKPLTSLERGVVLLVDEIYITARLDYRSKSIIGSGVNSHLMKWPKQF